MNVDAQLIEAEGRINAALAEVEHSIGCAVSMLVFVEDGRLRVGISAPGAPE